jgi:hypothetical protein
VIVENLIRYPCHYIDADWNLKDILVDFIDLSGPHSGENIANVFTKCLQDKKILTKVSIIFIMKI